MTGQSVDYLRTPAAIRASANQMLALGRAGKLLNWSMDDQRFPDVVTRVLALTRATYPDITTIPVHSRWRHFGVGGVDRAGWVTGRLGEASLLESLRTRFDLVVTSVLLDAGAGPLWTFREESGATFSRSEGLAVASVHMFLAGGFSSDPTHPLRADAVALSAIESRALDQAFQVDADNFLVGAAGRVSLLRRLGDAVSADVVHFPAPAGQIPRIGYLADYLLERVNDGQLSAVDILRAVLDGFGPIWPGRVSLSGINLGDVWPHPQGGLVPFHKLSQWLTYSLFEPLEAFGVKIVGADALTGLSEYRNGGLFVDAGVLVPRHASTFSDTHTVDSALIVEWRALTVALLDQVADEIRQRLNLTAAELPLAKVLEGGTWAAGRQIAREKRPDGSPPIRIDSDGTVF